jgi:hypothetical protein
VNGYCCSRRGTSRKRVDFRYFCTELFNEGRLIPITTDIPGRDEGKQKDSVG